MESDWIGNRSGGGTAEGGGGDGCEGGAIGLGEGRVKTSMLPWMREFEIRVLLEEMDDEDDERWRLLVVVFLSYMSLKLREVYLLVFAIHCEGMKMGRRWLVVLLLLL
ncbi:hypothetical protein HanIR_Chr16g0836671 [Helianthus annuus]|nr:hypothetical protein HanIR_Chr16g0836671 [Helianthus annuus]